MIIDSLYSILFFFFKQKTAYEMRISDWSSDVCSSDLISRRPSTGACRLHLRSHNGTVLITDPSHFVALGAVAGDAGPKPTETCDDVSIFHPRRVEIARQANPGGAIGPSARCARPRGMCRRVPRLCRCETETSKPIHAPQCHGSSELVG